MSNRFQSTLAHAVPAVFPHRGQAAVAGALGDPKVHGSLTRGFIKASANGFFGDSEYGSFNFTAFGVNAAIEPSSRVHLSGQMLSRCAGDRYAGSPDMDFVLADFSFRNKEIDSPGVKIGRIRNPCGSLNEPRDEAFARSSMSVPSGTDPDWGMFSVSVSCRF